MAIFNIINCMMTKVIVMQPYTIYMLRTVIITHSLVDSKIKTVIIKFNPIKSIVISKRIKRKYAFNIKTYLLHDTCLLHETCLLQETCFLHKTYLLHEARLLRVISLNVNNCLKYQESCYRNIFLKFKTFHLFTSINKLLSMYY